MSSTRFGILVGFAGVAVAVAAFLVGLQVLDDEGPDTPPAASSSDEPDEEADGGADGDEATSSTTAPVADGALDTPAWILVISSEGDEVRARAIAEEVAAAGHPAGVLRSDDYPSMNPGFWVAYAGPYPDAAAAQAAEPAIEADGWTGAYVRCAGTVEECGGAPAADGGDDDDDDDD